MRECVHGIHSLSWSCFPLQSTSHEWKLRSPSDSPSRAALVQDKGTAAKEEKQNKFFNISKSSRSVAYMVCVCVPYFPPYITHDVSYSVCVCVCVCVCVYHIALHTHMM